MSNTIDDSISRHPKSVQSQTNDTNGNNGGGIAKFLSATVSKASRDQSGERVSDRGIGSRSAMNHRYSTLLPKEDSWSSIASSANSSMTASSSISPGSAIFDSPVRNKRGTVAIPPQYPNSTLPRVSISEESVVLVGQHSGRAGGASRGTELGKATGVSKSSQNATGSMGSLGSGSASSLADGAKYANLGLGSPQDGSQGQEGGKKMLSKGGGKGWAFFKRDNIHSQRYQPYLPKDAPYHIGYHREQLDR